MILIMEGFILQKHEQMKVDRIVIQVLNQIADRSERGLEKYGTNLERTDLETLDWIQHAQEEAMDLCLYLERIKEQIKNKQL
jgi:histidinol dehydrogenase